MGESCLESFQDAQDRLPLTLAVAADGDLFGCAVTTHWTSCR
jgi:hypothetical protein